MDFAAYKAAQREEWEAKKAHPVSIEVTAEEFAEARHALMLLRRIQGNTKDIDLLRVEGGIVPLLSRINEAFRDVPEVKAAINAQREMLDTMLQERGQEKRLPPLP